MASRDVDELKVDYPDPEWRKKFVRMCDLIEVLGDCIISDEYTISDSLNDAIFLNQHGTAVRDRLIRKEGVAPKEAKLMCFLSLGDDQLFVDVDRCDLDQLLAAVNSEFEEQRIRFPFIFGRDLYDRYAELYEDEKESLTPAETMQLLDGLPKGVFQYGRYSLGPYGIREASTWRSMTAVRRVPAYHCSLTVCRKIHPVLLETSHSAAINRDREKLGSLLRSASAEPAEWWAFAADLNGLGEASYRDRQSVSLPLVGDTLSLTELRLLMVDLLDNTRGSFRSAIETLLVVSSAIDAVAELGRAEMLQLLLFAPETQIAASLDRLVRTEKIYVPPGEVRKPVVTHGIRSGAFRLQAELGHRGVRFASTNPGLALLRQRRLLDKLYLRDVDGDVSELEWQLRGIEIEDLDERLDHYFWRTNPKSTLERLILARRTNVITACEDVGIENFEGVADDELLETILWKLGFDIGPDADPHADFWTRHEGLWALTQSSNMGGSDRFLASASPYFSRLEGLLLDSLAFTAWALLTDHTDSPHPFSYDDEEDRQAGLALMNSIASSPSGAALYDQGKVDLGNLIGGFSALSRRLEKSAASPDTYARPASEFPDYVGKTDIKTFLLRSTVPFIDLTAPSRTRIVNGLKEITQLMTAAHVNLVRNDYSHYRRNAPDISKVEQALEATRQAVTRIETLGFCRLMFSPVRVLRDPWGRSNHEFKGPRSYEHSFARPTRFDWMGLPDLDEPAYLMRSASIGEPTEVLRFVPRHKSEFAEMWSGYPSRRRKPRSATTESPETYDAQASSSLA